MAPVRAHSTPSRCPRDRSKYPQLLRLRCIRNAEGRRPSHKNNPCSSCGGLAFVNQVCFYPGRAGWTVRIVRSRLHNAWGHADAYLCQCTTCCQRFFPHQQAPSAEFTREIEELRSELAEPVTAASTVSVHETGVRMHIDPFSAGACTPTCGLLNYSREGFQDPQLARHLNASTAHNS